MPLYEYACHDCGHRFEILQKLGEGAEGLACPKCDGTDVKKQFSTFASSSEAKASPAAAGCGTGSGFT